MVMLVSVAMTVTDLVYLGGSMVTTREEERNSVAYTLPKWEVFCRAVSCYLLCREVLCNNVTSDNAGYPIDILVLSWIISIML